MEPGGWAKCLKNPGVGKGRTKSTAETPRLPKLRRGDRRRGKATGHDKNAPSGKIRKNIFHTAFDGGRQQIEIPGESRKIKQRSTESGAAPRAEQTEKTGRSFWVVSLRRGGAQQCACNPPLLAINPCPDGR